MLFFLHIVGWLVCAIYSTIPGYWLLIHPRAEYWRTHHSPYRVLLPVWGCMFAVVLAATAPFRKLTLYDTPWSWLAAAALFVLGIWLYKAGGAHFSLQQLQGMPELSDQHAHNPLVTTGIRARLRHPVYLAHLTEMLAWTIGTGLLVCAALTLFAMVGGIFLIRTEDAELERRFGDQFRHYREAVPAIVPKFR